MVVSVAAAEIRPASAGLRLRIVDPEAMLPRGVDVWRLFRRRAITRRRRARLRKLPMVVATLGDQVVGLAAYERWGDDLRVHELACGADVSVPAAAVVTQLLECLELAALAGGASRVVILPWAVPGEPGLDRLGYGWSGRSRRGVEKRLA